VAAKAELRGIPLIGTILAAMQFIPIERGTPESRAASKALLLARMKDERFPPVLVFPQGTCADQQVCAESHGCYVPMYVHACMVMVPIHDRPEVFASNLTFPARGFASGYTLRVGTLPFHTPSLIFSPRRS
jgi:1-acyl-sn-glycerol-3-phosphate acyltransferase